MRHLLAILAALGLPAFASAQPMTPAGIRLQDEGVTKGANVQTLNCTGAGVTCSVAGTRGTIDVSSGGGGAPTTAQYWTGAADAGLSAELNLGALATGLVLNTAGTPSAYAGGTCTAPNFVRVISASGAVTCAAPTISLSSVTNPTGDWTATFPTGTKALWTFTGSTDEAFTIHGDGAFTGTGDLVHIHKSGTGATAGADALHVEVDADTNMTGVRITMPNATRTALSTNALVSAAGFSGPLTGAVTGNASTASALAGNGANCTGNQFALGVDASGAAECAQPAFSNLSGSASSSQLPAASTTLGAVKMAAACGAGNHVSSIGAGGELTCTADSGGGGAPTTAQYWVGTADGTLSAEKDLSGFTGLVLNTAGTPSSKATNTCTNQFPRSDNASGVWTCASIASTDLPAASTTLGAVKHAANCSAGQHVVGIGAGGELSCSADSGGTPSFSGLTAGGVMYANSTTTIVSTGTGTSGRSGLMSGGTGAPTWVQEAWAVTMTQDRSTSSTTGATTTDLTWGINANEGQTFTCNLTSTSTATSKIRYAVAGPASMTYVNCRTLSTTTALTTGVSGMLQGQWASTCTNCTPSVTASVLTSKLTDVLSCSVTNGSTGGSITIYFAAATAGQTNTLHKGSGCMVTGGG